MFTLLFLHAFFSGWRQAGKDYKQRQLINDIDILEDCEPDNNLLEEIATLEIIIERQKEMGKILDAELAATRNQKKRAILLNKLNALDAATLRNIRKLNKLKELE